MLTFFALFLFFVVGLVAYVYSRLASVKNVEPIDPQKARAFSDGVLDDLVHDRRDVLYAKLAKETLSREQLDSLIDQLNNQVGKVTEYEFVSDRSKISLLSKQASRDMTYKVTTTKGNTCPLTVILVANESELAIKEFYFAVATLTI